MKTNPISMTVLLALVVVFITGCGQSTTSSGTGGGSGGGYVARNPLGGVRRSVDRSRVENDFRQIATFYMQFHTENNRAPKSQKEFADYIQRDAPQLAEAINKGEYQIAENIRISGNTIVAKQAEPDQTGSCVVAMGNGQVQVMTAQELE